MSELTPAHRRLAAYIATHAPGKADAIPLPRVAEALGLSTRVVQTLKQELLDEAGVIICSSCGKPPGLYWPASVEDVLPYHRQQSNREKGSRKARLALERQFPQLREQVFRNPPKTIRARAGLMTAQGQLAI